MRLNKQRGMILVTALIFLQVIILLGIYAVTNGLLQLKMARYQWQEHLISIAAERALHQAENALIAKMPFCLIPEMSVLKISQQPLDWWKSSRSCAGNVLGIKYYYVVERLGEDSCAYLEDKIVADYFRLTLLSVNEKSKAKIVLQSTFIRPIQAMHECEGTLHRVVVGRQMWRKV